MSEEYYFKKYLKYKKKIKLLQDQFQVGAADGLFVNELGYISGAACLPEGKDENGTIRWLGHIENLRTFRMPAYAYTCEKTSCFCNTDLILSKFKEAVAV